MPCLTVVPTSGAGATPEDRRTGESTLNILPNSVHGEGAHGRSLRIVEAQGRVALRIYRHVGPPDVLEEGAQLPAKTACGVDADGCFPNTAGQDYLAPLGRSPDRLFSSPWRKRGRPTAINDVEAVGSGFIADIRPVGRRQGHEAQVPDAK